MTLAPPEVTSTITIALPALEPNGFPPHFALQAGLYEKYGLDVETVYIEGGGSSAQALAAGQVEAASIAAGHILPAIASGAELVQTTMHIPQMTDGLFTHVSVESGDDLRGRNIAIGDFGGEAHGAMVLALRQVGLAEDEVVFVQIGGQSARVAALAAGSVAGAPIDSALAAELEEFDLKPLVDLAETGTEFARPGLTFRRDWMEENPNTVLAMVAANLEAQQLIHDDPEAAITAFAEWIQEPDPENVRADIEAYLEFASRDLRWDPSAWEIGKEFAMLENPAVADIEITEGYTFEFLDQLEELGLNEALGIPES